MTSHSILSDPLLFSETLFEKMKMLSPGIQELELYEFRYGLAERIPELGWESVKMDSREVIETNLNNRSYYESIQIKPRVGDQIVLDP